MELEIGIFEQNQPKYTPEKDHSDSTKIPNTPMGDFQYDDNPAHQLSSDCSSSDFSDEIQLNSLCDTNEKLLDSLAKQLRDLHEELDVMIRRLDFTEEDILTRRDFCRDIERLNLEYGKQIGREVEQVEKMEFLIDHLKKSVLNRDEALENMKVIENSQLHDHFRRNKSGTDVSCCRESLYTSAESQ